MRGAAGKYAEILPVIPFSAHLAMPSIRRGVHTMKKVVVRKAGPVRLTSTVRPLYISGCPVVPVNA